MNNNLRDLRTPEGMPKPDAVYEGEDWLDGWSRDLQGASREYIKKVLLQLVKSVYSQAIDDLADSISPRTGLSGIDIVKVRNIAYSLRGKDFPIK